MPDTSQGTGTTQCGGSESGLCVAKPPALDVASSLVSPCVESELPCP